VTPASTQHGKRRLVSTLLVSSEGAHKLVEGNSRSIAVGCPSRATGTGWFATPAQVNHRRYEALRAFFIDGRQQLRGVSGGGLGPSAVGRGCPGVAFGCTVPSAAFS
jgi:hypothetical protein